MVIELPIVAAGTPGSDISAEQDGGALVRRTILPGGVRVITEKIPGMRSATIGAWVNAGSRDEVVGQHGGSHYLEHILFKGTRRRSAQEIAQAFDGVGGEANAATGKEHTCYYARILDKDVPLALDVIIDMITDPLLDVAEFERERGVILEEISMYADDPGDQVFENFTQSLFPDHPLGHPILGTTDEIQELSHSAVLDYYRGHYTGRGLVIAAAGGVDHDEICAQVTRALSSTKWDLDPGIIPAERRSVNPEGLLPIRSQHAHYRPGNQANLVIGSRGLGVADPRRYALSVLHAIYGGGMSSRLFQEIREKHGLAYSVHSFSTGYADAGIFGVYAGCAVENAPQVLELISEQWELLARDGVTASEIEQAKGQARGGLVLGLEDSGARMSRLGRAELVYGEISSIDEVISKIDAVQATDIMELVHEFQESPVAHAAVGPFDDDLSEIIAGS